MSSKTATITMMLLWTIISSATITAAESSSLSKNNFDDDRMLATMLRRRVQRSGGNVQRAHSVGERSRASPMLSLVNRTPSKSKMHAKYLHRSGAGERSHPKPPASGEEEEEEVNNPGGSILIPFSPNFSAFSWPQCSNDQICSNGEYDESRDCYLSGCDEGETCDEGDGPWCSAITTYCYNSESDTCTQPTQSCFSVPCENGEKCVTSMEFECSAIRVCKSPPSSPDKDDGSCLFTESGICRTNEDCPGSQTCVSPYMDCTFEFEPSEIPGSAGISALFFIQCDQDTVCKNGPFEEWKDCDYVACSGDDTCDGDVICDGDITLCYDPEEDTCTKPEYNCFELTKPCPSGQKCVSQFSEECFSRPVDSTDMLISAFTWPQCANDTKCTNDEYDESRDCSLYDDDYCEGDDNYCNYDGNWCDANVYFCHDPLTNECRKPEYSCNNEETPCPEGTTCVNQFSDACTTVDRVCQVQRDPGGGAGTCLLSTTCQNDDDCGSNQLCVGIMHCMLG